MINLIDNDFENNQRYFGIAQFDVIIFDEIHRSVYNKYKAIFEYFDGYKIGLTATPKSDADKDTYNLFGLQPGVPTFAYELDQAVTDKYLVPYHGKEVPIKFHRQGIKYKDLSPDEKLNYETLFADPLTGDFPDEIDNKALNNWLFNTDTIDKVIAYLMRHGIKVAGGDRLGKTIFFARSHKHALFIKERFDKQYPHYGGHFCQVIDNYQEYAYDILNRFSEKESNPHIAISVDMLDTGIDVPEVVNLVFIKTIKSKTKFLQMIGRGTRLCKNLFGPDDDKTHFLIFDFLENFEFFGNKPKGDDSNQGKSLSQRLFAQRLKLVNVLQKQEEEDLCNYAKELQQYLFKQVTSLEDHSFLVRQHWREVEKYKDPLQWNALNELDTKELVDHIATLVIEADEDEMAKRFDLICYNMQVDLMLKGSINNSQKEEIQTLAGNLTKKASIPAVAAKLFVLQDIQKSIFWKDISILKAEKLRKDMRNLMKFIDKEDVRIVYASFNDEYFGDVKEYTMSLATNDLEAYRKKVAHYIQSHQNHITIHKLKMNIPITTSELRVVDEMLFEQGEIGNKEQFEKVYGIQPLGKFIRSIVGLDVTAAKEVFVKFINAPALNAQQIRFVDTIIQYLTVNGTIEASALFAAPFTDISTNGLTDVFDNTQSAEIVSMVERVNRNALVAG